MKVLSFVGVRLVLSRIATLPIDAEGRGYAYVMNAMKRVIVGLRYMKTAASWRAKVEVKRGLWLILGRRGWRDSVPGSEALPVTYVV